MLSGQSLGTGPDIQANRQVFQARATARQRSFYARASCEAGLRSAPSYTAASKARRSDTESSIAANISAGYK
jgi:hypothetical protein